ncbi:KGGVGR-motif variant AAA ATPase [Intestinibacter sp.]|uniref:KGGVGR-motif variant AAA ATPase n=2 Tax=Intestinibacter sp. TaxID=1965304 RepID=UPI002A74AA3F|nr:AAA family ATPase [Intestinibacter sp.]MDY2735517.1 AAA family ATPase [Intestinibacter sp.]
MSNLEIRNYIENELKNKFIKYQEQEWINVHIDAQNFIDINIVSDNINRKQVKSYVKDLIDAYPEYKIGMVMIYSVEEAEEYEVINSPSKKRPSNLVEAIDYIKNSYEINNNRKFKSEVISFYSYKGGVGRTLALIHTAYLLAQRGKNVLMLDLDIEAPSMQNIFKSEIEEIDYGLIDYLYNKMYEKGTNKKVTIPDIYVKVDGSKDENISGNLYVVPSGKLNTEYIYKLSKIQPNLVSRNNYISDLIKDLESKQELNLDFVLVDSRTGINDWGGLSLIDVSDRVIFFVYPNEENMEGSRALMNLVRNSKSGNVSVVFSRVDVKAYDQAVKLYDSLNKELDLDQDYVAISYDPDIAISKEFPVQKMLGKCESIVDMILDPEGVEINRQFLSKFDNEKKTKLLRSIKKLFDQENVTKKERINMEKIQEDNIYLVILKSQDLLNKYLKLFPRQITGIKMDKDDLNKYHYNNIVDNKLFETLGEYLESYEWVDIWHIYIIKLVNDYIKAIDDLVDKNMNSYLEYIKNNNIIELYKKILDKQRKESIKKYNDIVKVCKQEEIYKDKINLMLYEDIYNKIVIFINSSNWLDYEMMSKCLKGLKLISTFFEKNNIDIAIKIFKQDDDNIDKVYLLKDFKSNILRLEWKKGDIQEFIERTISKLLSLDKNRLNKSILDLFWGKKVIVNNKKINTIDYFCDKLEEIDKFNIIDANEILVKAIDIEMKSDFSKMNDRIISQDSIEKAFETFNE